MASCFMCGFPPLGKWVSPLWMAVCVTGLLAGFCKRYGGPGPRPIPCFAKALIAVGELAFGIAGAREIEVVAIADGLAERKCFQLGIIDLAFFWVISNSLQPITWTAKA